jgi:adenylate cyclase
MPINRKLVAVVMADVVGYSRLMERDESGTHQRLRALNDDLFTPKIAEHGGRTVKTAGDGMLLEFPSATSALRCAVEIQREMGVRNLYVAPDERIEFRIGINLGDIIVEGNDIIGDGVNVAARLETLAEPGGICVASAVWEQVHEDLGVEFIDSGQQHVKNISNPIRIYRVALGKGATRSDRPFAGEPSASRGRRFGARRIAIAAAAVVAIAAIVSWQWWPPRPTTAPTSIAGPPAATIDRRAPAVRRTGERSRPRDTLGVAGRRRGERTRQQCPRRAAAAKAELMKRVPDFTISRLDARRFSPHPVWIEEIRNNFHPGLRKAGVPE